MPADTFHKINLNLYETNMSLVEYWHSTIGDWNTLMELVQNDTHFVKNIRLEVIPNFPYDWMFWNLFTMIDDRH